MGTPFYLLIRILELLSDVIQVVPPRIREQTGVKGQGDISGAPLRALHGIDEMLNVPNAQIINSGNDNDQHCEQFGERENVLHPRHPFDVVAVDDGEKTGGGGGQETHRFVRDGTIGTPDWLQDVLGEGDGGDRVPGRHQDEQRHPQVKEGGKRTERFADVGVVASRFWNHCT